MHSILVLLMFSVFPSVLPQIIGIRKLEYLEWDFLVDPVTYCYGEIGCITIDDSWYDPISRPINQEPLPREKINTRFILHTRERPTQVRNSNLKKAEAFIMMIINDFRLKGYYAVRQ